MIHPSGFFASPADGIRKSRDPAHFSYGIFKRSPSQKIISKKLTGKRERNLGTFLKIAKQRFRQIRNLHFSQ